MIEKQEAEEFDDADDDALDNDEGESADIARLTKDLDQSRKRGAKQAVPAWRKLELLAEQRRTRELTSDFEDYVIDKPGRSRRSTI